MFCSTIKDIIYKEFNMNAHISIRFKDRITSTRTLKVCGKQMFRFLSALLHCLLPREYKKFQTLWFRTNLMIVTRDGGAKGVGLTCKGVESVFTSRYILY